MRTNNSLVVNQQSVGTGSFISSAFWVSDVVRASFQVTIGSGACNGTFVIQGSNDQAVGAFPTLYQPTNWNTITSATVVCSASAGNSFLILQNEYAYEYLRVQFTAGNGGAALGTANVRMKAFSI
jgi:hypothetical protein